MNSPVFARDFLKTHLPKKIAELVDWTSLSLQPKTFITELNKELIADLVFKTQFDNKEGYIYLLVEHQSTPDKLMPFRILKYTCEVINYHLSDPKNKNIPLVYPVVVYQGKRPYPYSTDINSLVDAPKLLVDEYFLKPFHLIDLPSIDDAKLRTSTWSGVVAFTMKHIFKRDLLPYMHDIFNLIAKCKQPGDEKISNDVLQYLMTQGDIRESAQLPKLIAETLSKSTEDDVTTIAEYLKNRGREEGLKKGISQGISEGLHQGKTQTQQQIALNLLKEFTDNLEIIARATGLTQQEILELEAKAAQTS